MPVIDATLKRSQAIEVVRIIAAYGIVAFHAGVPFNDVAYGGLIAFLILSPAVDLSFNWDRGSSISTLARKILLPWAFWWCVYGLFSIVMHKGASEPIDWPTLILSGTSPHLWFLPFIFAVLVVLNAVKPRVSRFTLLALSTVIAAVLLISAPDWRSPSLSWPLPLPQWIHALPAICIGIAFGLSSRVGKSAIVSCLAIAGALLWALTQHLPGVGISYAVGAIAVAIAMLPSATKSLSMLNVQPLSACMMGVYLTHILWMQIIAHFAGPPTYLSVTLTFAVALVTVYAARRIVPMSKFVLG